MAFKSTKSWSHLRVVREVEAIGGNIFASASREQMGYSFDALKTYVPEMILDKRTRSISMGSDYPQNSAGLIILNNESIQSFLLSASNDSRLSPELQATALNLCSLNNVPYKSIRHIWVESNPSTRPNLFHLFTDSEFVFTSPKPREKSEELKARLRKLAERAERDEYRELVKDIMPKNDGTEPLSSYKDQLGFGIHVALIMFTGYLVGYFAFREHCLATALP